METCEFCRKNRGDVVYLSMIGFAIYDEIIVIRTQCLRCKSDQIRRIPVMWFEAIDHHKALLDTQKMIDASMHPEERGPTGNVGPDDSGIQNAGPGPRIEIG